jgi:hypothetical protein
LKKADSIVTIMHYANPVKCGGVLVTTEEEDMVRSWIAEFLGTNDIAVIQAYYLFFAISTGMRDNSILVNDMKTLTPEQFVQKHSMGLFSKRIWTQVYDKAFFDERFPERYESLHSNES